MKTKFKVVFNAPVTLVFVGLCFIVTILGVITGGETTRLLFMTYHSPLSSPITYIRFFTHVFGHSDFNHFIGNASYLLLLGPILEEKYGSTELLEVIGFTAVITGIVNYVFFWNVALCGASGVVFAFILLSSITGFKDGEIPITFILVAVFYIGQQVIEGLTVKDNISNMAHIVGGIVGAFLGFAFQKMSFGQNKK